MLNICYFINRSLLLQLMYFSFFMRVTLSTLNSVSGQINPIRSFLNRGKVKNGKGRGSDPGIMAGSRYGLWKNSNLDPESIFQNFWMFGVEFIQSQPWFESLAKNLFISFMIQVFFTFWHRIPKIVYPNIILCWSYCYTLKIYLSFRLSHTFNLPTCTYKFFRWQKIKR